MIYRTPSYNLPKPELVRISRTVYLLRKWIARIDADGTVTRKDGVVLQGDITMLRDEGLL